MIAQLTNRSSNPPLGAGGDWRRRLLLHHAPLALASVLVLVIFMNLAPFEVRGLGQPDIFSGTFPKEFEGDVVAQHTAPRARPSDPSGGQAPQQPTAGHQIPEEIRRQIPAEHLGGQPPSQPHAEQTPVQPGEEQTVTTEHRGGQRSFLGLNVRQFTFASGYVALVLLGLTLLVGPANLLLRRRRPISNYLARDVGMWAAVFSVIHVIYGIEVHAGITNPLPMFVRVADGTPVTNSFGLANWTGLAATVLVVGLLAISSDFALRKLKARIWKNLQRLNYALFALVAVHAFFYGALLRTESPFTLLLGISVGAVLLGQTVGIWLWRRRSSGTATAAAGV